MMQSISAIALMVRRGLRHHLFASAVTIAAAALASGLVMSVFSIQRQAREAFAGGPVGFDAVLGARGSELQLVLNTVFHLETSPGNIPWTLYREIADDPRVARAIPYATGDNFYGFRIVGTTAELFEPSSPGESSSRRVYSLAEGNLFEPRYAEAVLGSSVARETGLRIGDIFHPYHGVVFDPTAEHAEEYTVVGILEPTNSPSDRVIWIPIEGVFRMEGHVLRGTGEIYEPRSGESIPDEHKEVSAVMLKLKNPRFGFDLAMTVNRQGNAATLAYPIGRVMAELFEKLGWVHRVFALVSYLVVAVAAGGILASLYNTINERRRELAILRSLGARRSLVFTAIVSEAAVLGGLGAVLGFGVYGVALGIAAKVVRTQTGVVLEVFAFHPSFVWVPIGMVALGALAGAIPALKAYSTDVATHLVPHS